MPTSRLLRSGKYMKRYAFAASSAIKSEAKDLAKNLRAEGKKAAVRKGGNKWDVFSR